MTLATYLKTKRKEAGLNQTALSELLNYQTSQFISNWERGVSVPPAKTIEPLSKALGVPREELANKVVDWILVSHSLDVTEKYGV